MSMDKPWLHPISRLKSHLLAVDPWDHFVVKTLVPVTISKHNFNGLYRIISYGNFTNLRRILKIHKTYWSKDGPFASSYTFIQLKR